MTKARAILKIFMAKRILKSVCKEINVSYKYCYAIASGDKLPSYNFMKKFMNIIPVNYWFEEITKEFLDKITQNIDTSRTMTK